MRRGFLILNFALSLVVRAWAADAAPAPIEPPVPPLLLEALTKLSQDFDHWAYTETRHLADPDGKPRGETVIRFDPSKPYAEQYLPLKIDGQTPTPRQLKDYQKRGERRGDRLAREEAAGQEPGSGEMARFRLNGDNAAIDPAHAVVTNEADASITFNVPLRNDAKSTLPVEKFELLARVNKERRAFENVTLRLRDSFRMKLVVKVQGGSAANVDFGVVDPKFVPVVTSVSGAGTISVLFLKFGGSIDLKRTDFQRVKPYSERFGVKIGPMKALDF